MIHARMPSLTVSRGSIMPSRDVTVAPADVYLNRSTMQLFVLYAFHVDRRNFDGRYDYIREDTS